MKLYICAHTNHPHRCTFVSGMNSLQVSSSFLLCCITQIHTW